MVDAEDDKNDPFQLIVAELSDALANPTDTIPSVRCVSRTVLVGIVNDLASKLGIPEGRIPSGSQAIARLVKAKLLRSIPFDDVAPRVGKKRLFAVGMGVDVTTLHPLELLQAHVPAGIVCYMSALEVHELTTQPTMHHHIGRRETAPTRLRVADEEPFARATTAADGKTGTPATPPLGQWQFAYQGLRYYLTAREPQLLRSYQIRYLNDKSWFRVTTLEQTLIDTLHRPVSCGGPAIVFEAWETATEKLDPVKMTTLLEQIGDARLSRRAGYMLGRLGFNVTAPEFAVDETAIPLLPGVPYSTLDPRWRLFVP